ncbi:Dolichyl-diphosphooligosaccharide-protein glycosyltransferase 48kDa subunit [Viridothelium virens]|uniref:Dolichyl-diphosphooligosaccharide--protein glycosyltransferase subunit WBP1 n=1 Tax=Viridothelium virens TaxID=1048519 RepID=A0A6A6HIT0_VIRVR|nr:Dolichyl-diphosphooligosaccharide-protein glycosyltransferase 48kDa subunit [Viridothelium virens]
MRAFLSFLLPALVGVAQALSYTGTRLLVVNEDASEKDNYSKFWGDLESRGFRISFESPKNEKLSLFELGERAYDHLILLPPKSKGFGPNLSPKNILDFAKKEGNVILALSGDSPTPAAINSLLLELDIHLPPDRNALLVDHFNYDISSAPEKHDVLVLPPIQLLRTDLNNFFETENPVAAPRVVGQVLGNASPHLAPILKAPSTAYSYNPKDEAEAVEDPFAFGSQLSIASAMQARNSARFTVLGSAEMLENKWFDASVKLSGKQTKTGNQDFAKKLSEWTFQEVGVLKVGELTHYQNEGDKKGVLNQTAIGASELNPKIYKIKDDVTYTIELSEWSHDHFIPYVPPPLDALQLECTMLSPFHRLPLLPSASLSTPNATLYTASFTLPDQHGIFNFRVNYKRPFLTSVDEKRTVTVRHMAHDEYTRSFAISGAYVWITGIWTTVVGWVLFLGMWLYARPTEEERKAKGKKAQ